MSVTAQKLEDKLYEMYPEIRAHKLGMGLNFDSGKDAWIVHLKRDDKDFTTHLEAKDAEDCLNGIKCIYLGVQIGQFVKNIGGA
ncbi:MAG TPA: hypothetical protein DCZ69_07620 [Syntrophobacteraceae bacterium]|nr:hypothetical protein [Syntrophobacteraceae bacterium]HBD08117.1 hypothetical protein [Syntrophobacteraceae bacterium]HBZ55632.1 hypothetical protein [Syntrophobacteraceae bacterium]